MGLRSLVAVVPGHFAMLWSLVLANGVTTLFTVFNRAGEGMELPHADHDKDAGKRGKDSL